MYIILESFKINVGVLEILLDEDTFLTVTADNMSTGKVDRIMINIQRNDDRFTGYTDKWLTNNIIGKVKNI